MTLSRNGSLFTGVCTNQNFAGSSCAPTVVGQCPASCFFFKAHSACITALATSHPGIASVARTPVFGVRGSSLAKTGNLKGRRLPSGSEARVSGRTADLKGGGLRYARLNPAWESTLGYTRDELKAKRFVDFVNPDDVGATQKATITKMLRP